MIASAGAAGAMIGLLFVVVSLRAELVFGKSASKKSRTLALCYVIFASFVIALNRAWLESESALDESLA